MGKVVKTLSVPLEMWAKRCQITEEFSHHNPDTVITVCKGVEVQLWICRVNQTINYSYNGQSA